MPLLQPLVTASSRAMHKELLHPFLGGDNSIGTLLPQVNNGIHTAVE